MRRSTALLPQPGAGHIPPEISIAHVILSVQEPPPGALLCVRQRSTAICALVRSGSLRQSRWVGVCERAVARVPPARWATELVQALSELACAILSVIAADRVAKNDGADQIVENSALADVVMLLAGRRERRAAAVVDGPPS